MVVGPTLALLKKKAIPEFLKLFKRWFNLGEWNATDKIFRFSEAGSRKTFPDWDGDTPTVVFFGYASDPDTLESATAKACWCDEAGQKKFRLTSWEAILRRLSLAQGRVLITTTPYDLGWLKQQIYDRAVRVGTEEEQPGDRDYRTIRFDSTENPQFNKAEFERAKRDLPPWKFDLFYRGIFTRPAGQIYDCFKNTYDGKPHPHAGPVTAHKCRPFKIPAHWPRIVGVDFGNVNTAAVKIAENPATRPRGGKLFSGRCYLYAEYHEGNRTEAQHVEALTAGEPEGATLRAVGGARSEGGWRQGYADAGLPIMEPPIPDVEVGINRGYAIINSDNLIVFDDCVKFLDEVTSYSRVLTDVGEPTDEIEEKSSYHMCFVAGTMIDTANGRKPIEDMRVGDMALTRNGYKPVIASGLTCENANVLTLTASNGSTLTGTGNHPVYLRGKGFVSLDSLRYGDIIEVSTITESIKWNAKQLYSTELPTIVTPTRRNHRIGTILSTQGRYSTGRYGNLLTVPSLTDAISTTKTEILSITTFQILMLSLLQFISQITTRVNIIRQLWRILIMFVRSLKHGTLPSREESGTASTAKRFGKIALLPGLFVPIAANNVNVLQFATKTNSAPINVNPRGGEKAELITKNERVPIAGTRSKQINTANKSVALICVLHVKDAGIAPVYNLSVADSPEYYANDILVHNCDAYRYSATFIRHTEGDILMFPEWSEFIHTCPPAWTNGKPDILPSHWRYYGGVYSRANMPFAFVLRAIDEHGTLHTMESVAFEDLTAKEQAYEVGRVLNRWDIPFHKCPISGHPDMWSERNFNGVKSPGVSIAFRDKGLKLYESRAEDAHGWERIKTALKAKGAPKDATRRAFLVWDKTNENLIKLFPVVHYQAAKNTDGTGGVSKVAETRIMALHQALRLSEDVEPKIPSIPKKPVSEWLPFALQTERVGGRKE